MSVLSQFFQNQLAFVKSEYQTNVKPIISDATAAVIANPTEGTVVAQASTALVKMIALGPTVLADEIKDVATFIQGQLNPATAPAATTTGTASTTANVADTLRPTSSQG